MIVGDWKITYQGVSWTDDDMTVADACEISALVGDGWRSIDPLASPIHLATVVAVLASRETGQPTHDILLALRLLKASELAGMIQIPEA